jgi:hypothetical protein
MMTTVAPELACATLTAFGEADRLNPSFTVSLSIVVLLRVPELPVMVSAALPVAAVALAVSASVLLEVAGFGLNEAVTPLGKPEAVRLTSELNPLTGVIVILVAPWLN